MKKLLSLLLCLMMLVPVAASAQTAAETQTLDLGDFTVELGMNDAYQLGEKAHNQVMAIIYVDYDPNADALDNFNVVWSQDSITDTLALYDNVEEYATLTMEQSAAAIEELKIDVLDYQLLDAVYKDNICVIVTYMNADYTGAGFPVQLEQYQMQVYVPQPDNSTYIFTFTATDLERLYAISTYLDGVSFK